MARYRTLDGDMWKHRDIRRAPLQVGWLFAYLVTAQADDEGRFVADAWALAEDAFSSTHGVGEAEVEAALHFLAETGLVELYEVAGVRYGFLTGWFEHQYIKNDRRQSSSFPPPPCAISSWERADEVREACAKERGWGIQKITYEEALRWHKQRGFQSGSSLEPDWNPKGPLGFQTGTTLEPDWKPEGEGEGGSTQEESEENDRAREGESDDLFNNPAPQSPRRLCVDPDPAADNAHEKQGYPLLGSWLHEHCKRWPKLIRDRWLMDIIAAIESASDTWLTSEQQAVALLEEYEPKGAEKNLPAKWLERVEQIVAPKQRNTGQGMMGVSNWAAKRREVAAAQAAREDGGRGDNGA